MHASADPNSADVRVELCASSISAEAAVAWATRPDCGAVVSFLGTVRDNSEGREHVYALEYEAYEPYALDRMRELAAIAMERFAPLGRLALLHRTGRLEVGDVAVVVVASAPHRAAAFEAAKFCIDTLKETVPIWKREAWEGGSDWGLGAQELRDPSAPLAGAPGDP